MIRSASRILVVAILAAPLAAWLRAEVVRIEVHSRADILGGKAFGRTGPYERLSGKVHFAVDPRNSANGIITDIDKAPKNAAGKVEFVSDFYLIKPASLERGNGTVLYEVSNRGGKGIIGFFNRASGSLEPETAAHFGDAFLLEEGFTLLWLGWQFDPPHRDGLLRMYPPVARNSDGSSIQGLVRSTFVPAQKTQEGPLADRDHIAYPAADPKDPVNVLTVRDAVEGTRRTIPRDQWEFTEDRTRVHMASGFEPHKIYEVVYKAQDPPVVGVGPAAVRDMVSRLKYASCLRQPRSWSKEDTCCGTTRPESSSRPALAGITRRPRRDPLARQ